MQCDVLGVTCMICVCVYIYKDVAGIRLSVCKSVWNSHANNVMKYKPNNTETTLSPF